MKSPCLTLSAFLPTRAAEQLCRALLSYDSMRAMPHQVLTVCAWHMYMYNRVQIIWKMIHVANSNTSTSAGVCWPSNHQASAKTGSQG